MAVVGAGCGLRQGEIFGLRVQDVEYLRRRLQVQQQVKIVRGRLVIDKPKNRRTRTVRLPDWVAVEVTEHLRRWPAGNDGLVFTSREHKPLHRSHVNAYIWKPALEAVGIETERRNGMHALRHFHASVLIDAGESAEPRVTHRASAQRGTT